MYIVLVHVKVKTKSIELFTNLTLENAKSSLEEPGVARFDFIQELEDPANFILVEVYRTPDDAVKHKDTAHYIRWRDAVADMMAEPRFGIKYTNVFPEDTAWS